jgi:hypothetical protein
MLRVWREFTDDIASSNAGLRDSSVEHHISGAIFQSELFIPLSISNFQNITKVISTAGRRDIKTAARGSREHQR